MCLEATYSLILRRLADNWLQRSDTFTENFITDEHSLRRLFLFGTMGELFAKKATNKQELKMLALEFVSKRSDGS